MTVSLTREPTALHSANSVHTPAIDPGHAQPVWILAVMMALMPALGVPNEFMLQDTLKSAVLAVGVLMAALVFVVISLRKARTVHWHGLMWLPLSLCAYAVGSMVWSHSYLAGVEAVRWGLLSLLLWTGLNTFSRANVPVLVWGIHAGATVASLWAVLQGWAGLSWFPQVAMPASTFVNRNFFAEYLVCTLPFSVYALVQCCKAWWALPMALSLALNTVALLMTGTRSATLAFLLTLPLMAWTLWRHRSQWYCMQWPQQTRRLTAMVLVVGVVGSGLIPMNNQNPDGQYSSTLSRSVARTASVTSATEYTQGSFYIRSTMWKATASMVMAYPWTGVGAGAWEVHVPLYGPEEELLEIDYYAHNEFIQLLGEYGLVVGGGFAALLFAYFILYGQAALQHSIKGNRSSALWITTALSSLSALLIVSLAGFPWRMAGTGALLALCLAILATLDAKDWTSNPVSRVALNVAKPWVLRLTAGLLIVAIAISGFVTWRAAKAEKQWMQLVYEAELHLAKEHLSNSETDGKWHQSQLENIRQNMALHPHYRKLSALAANAFFSMGDWQAAAMLLESIAASRPHIPAVWRNLALANSKLGRAEQAQAALVQLQRLRPHLISTVELEVRLLLDSGQTTSATQRLLELYAQSAISEPLLQLGYAIGTTRGQWGLAIKALELHIAHWPAQKANSYLRLGLLYSDPLVNDQAKALEAYKAALSYAKPNEMSAIWNKIPSSLHPKMQ